MTKWPSRSLPRIKEETEIAQPEEAEKPVHRQYSLGVCTAVLPTCKLTLPLLFHEKVQ